jgi:hypothetical protein
VQLGCFAVFVVEGAAGKAAAKLLLFRTTVLAAILLGAMRLEALARLGSGAYGTGAFAGLITVVTTTTTGGTIAIGLQGLSIGTDGRLSIAALPLRTGALVEAAGFALTVALTLGSRRPGAAGRTAFAAGGCTFSSLNGGAAFS